jgi:hypothetical protein
VYIYLHMYIHVGIYWVVCWKHQAKTNTPRNFVCCIFILFIYICGAGDQIQSLVHAR